jgi:hypothetical protein
MNHSRNIPHSFRTGHCARLPLLSAVPSVLTEQCNLLWFTFPLWNITGFVWRSDFYKNKCGFPTIQITRIIIHLNYFFMAYSASPFCPRIPDSIWIRVCRHLKRVSYDQNKMEGTSRSHAQKRHSRPICTQLQQSNGCIWIRQKFDYFHSLKYSFQSHCTILSSTETGARRRADNLTLSKMHRSESYVLNDNGMTDEIKTSERAHATFSPYVRLVPWKRC